MSTIKFCSLASGSDGNSYYVESKSSKILVDAGLNGKKTKEALEEISVDIRELDGIFISHEHRDHISGAGVLSRRYNLPIFANRETWQAMEEAIGKIEKSNRREFSIEDRFYFRDLYIEPIRLFHDGINPNGYLIQTDQAKISIVTDTGLVNQEMLDQMADSDLYLIESNHDETMLREGDYPLYLKERVLSTRGHLSNDYCARVLEILIKGKGEKILLSHLSSSNNCYQLALEESRKRLERAGLDLTNGSVDLDIAPRRKRSKFIDLRNK